MTTSTSPPFSGAEPDARQRLTWHPAPPGPGRDSGASAGPGQVPWPPLLVADGLLERGVVAAFSGRAGGSGQPPYDSLNLDLHVGDEVRAVLRNRRRVATVLGLAGMPWAAVHQVHGNRVVRVTGAALGAGPPEAKPRLADADGMVTTEPGIVLVVLTADCVPLLLADPVNRVVGAVHAGWRGLAAGAVEAGVAAMAAAGADPASTVALVGPAIGGCCYQVGPEVADALAARYPVARSTTRGGQLAVETALAARQALERAGLDPAHVTVAGECTHHLPERYFSYRRDGRTGRQAGLIALSAPGPAARPASVSDHHRQGLARTPPGSPA
jgi:YfiH family protein